MHCSGPLCCHPAIVRFARFSNKFFASTLAPLKVVFAGCGKIVTKDGSKSTAGWLVALTTLLGTTVGETSTAGLFTGVELTFGNPKFLGTALARS